MLKPLCNFFLTLFSLYFFFIISFADDSVQSSQSQVYSTHDCGNGVMIKYPFWYTDSNTSNQYCGYPNFNLSCSDNQPILSLSSNNYYVKNISYSDYNLTLVDIDVTGQTCPRARHNLTLENLPLNYTTFDLNLTFYFNCTSNPFSFTPSPIECLGFGTLQSYVIVMENGIDDVDWFGKCEEKVVATVMRTENTSSNLINGFGGAMNNGFVLDWRRAKDCGDCEDSGGLCGYDNTAEKFLCFCSDGTVQSDWCKGKGPNVKMKIIIGIFGGIGMLFTCGVIYCFMKFSSFSLWEFKKSNQDLEAFLNNHGPLSVTRYNFSEVKRMTNFFKDKLGQGGYGSVYKGKLVDGRFVAVKVLNSSKGEGEEFINEVASIMRTSHVNIVTLLGFCLQGQNKALIYEFMPNGSLEKCICSRSILKTNQLEWKIMHQIAIGIARGLEYLHRGCNTRIVHFDIKPHNILLDENFCPKISDFGLAKLYTKTDSIISMLEARGTIGYIAPEVFSRNFGGVSYKSDVYSYGMMVLEMTGGREKDENGGDETSTSSEKYFPYWVYKRLELGNECELYGEISIEETEIVRKMTLVGLWCIQTNPLDRPSMSKVIQMLEGSSQTLTIPPKPFLFSPPKSPPLCSFTTSMA